MGGSKRNTPYSVYGHTESEKDLLFLVASFKLDSAGRKLQPEKENRMSHIIIISMTLVSLIGAPAMDYSQVADIATNTSTAVSNVIVGDDNSITAYVG